MVHEFNNFFDFNTFSFKVMESFLNELFHCFMIMSFVWSDVD